MPATQTWRHEQMIMHESVSIAPANRTQRRRPVGKEHTRSQDTDTALHNTPSEERGSSTTPPQSNLESSVEARTPGRLGRGFTRSPSIATDATRYSDLCTSAIEAAQQVPISEQAGDRLVEAASTPEPILPPQNKSRYVNLYWQEK